MKTNHLDRTTGKTCSLFRGDRSPLPCGRKAVACLLSVVKYKENGLIASVTCHGTPVCKRCLAEILSGR